MDLIADEGRGQNIVEAWPPVLSAGKQQSLATVILLMAYSTLIFFYLMLILLQKWLSDRRN